MLSRLFLAASFVSFFSASAGATSWGLNSFGDTVYWSDVIVVAQVTEVVSTEKPIEEGFGKPLGKADLRVLVIERLKGNSPKEILVTGVDLGDPTGNASPYMPLPKNLEDVTLLLFLRGNGRYEGYGRFAVEDAVVQNVAFADLRGHVPLSDVRAVVAQLNLIQSVCPRDKHKVVNEEAALAACRTALHSQYDPVIWYGARRLIDYDVPRSFAPDLVAALEEESSYFPVAYLLVQALGKAGDERGVPAVVGLMKKNPETGNDTQTIEALKAMTGESFDTSEQWLSWWESERQARGEED